MNTANRVVIFCENKVRRHKKKYGEKSKPPSYKKSHKHSGIDMKKYYNFDIPKIPPPPYESYDQYCKRTGKTPSSNPFEGYANTNHIESNFEWSSDILN